MNKFDVGILLFFNQFAHHSKLLDGVINSLASQTLFKGMLMVALLWWIWFKPGKANATHRQVVVATLLAAILAVVVGRLLSDFLPFRLRPLQTPGLGFTPPFGATPDTLRNWSSFPSDHAMVFFAISTGLWFVSNTLGLMATLYVLVIIALPRVYMGFHYPTDIIGGALFGVLFAYCANIESIRVRLAAPALKWLDLHPASFYACFFLISEELANLFDSVRHLAISMRALLI